MGGESPVGSRVSPTLGRKADRHAKEAERSRECPVARDGQEQEKPGRERKSGPERSVGPCERSGTVRGQPPTAGHSPDAWSSRSSSSREGCGASRQASQRSSGSRLGSEAASPAASTASPRQRDTASPSHEHNQPPAVKLQASKAATASPGSQQKPARKDSGSQPRNQQSQSVRTA